MRVLRSAQNDAAFYETGSYDLAIDESGDVGSAGNMQFEQGFLGVFFGEMIPVQDWGNGMSHFCVANYLVKFNPMHLVILYTNSGI
jgi:hypothetical protein